MQSQPRPVVNRYAVFGRRASARRARRGSEILELVIVLPVLIFIGLGIVAFGVFYGNRQQVALASRVGAEEASQTAGLPTSGGVPQNILDAVTKHLESSCIKVHEVRLEHNVGGGPFVLTSPGTSLCQCGPTNPLDPTSGSCGPILGTYVRVTVCVEMEELMPNLLAAFGSGIQVCGKLAQATTTFRYELN